MTEVAKALNRQRQQEESYLHLNGGQAEDIQVGQIDVSGASLFPTYDKYKKRIPPQRIVSRCGGTPAYQKKAATYSPAGWAVPSARPGLTSLCGMGRGGTPEP